MNESKQQYFPCDIDKLIEFKNNHLTIVGMGERKSGDRSWRVKCKCDCGNTKDIMVYQVLNGSVKSCGCLRNTLYTKQDGRSKHPLYGIWRQMMQRCYNPKSKIYYRYGGRGIVVCDEWHNFFNFAKWSDSIGGRPNGFTIDRINNDGPYSPDNCRWASMKTQNMNKSDNIVIQYNGKSQTLAEWAKDLNINWITLHNRYVRGWSIERMLTEPVHTKSKSTGA